MPRLQARLRALIASAIPASFSLSTVARDASLPRSGANDGVITELRHIRNFVRVVECGSFTGAAAELTVVQSALRQQTSRLRRELSTRMTCKLTLV